VRSAEARQGCTDLSPSQGNPVPCDLPDGRGANLLFARPPLVVRLEIVGTADRLSLVVNHFKSKSGDEAVNAPLRHAMADHVAGLVRELKAEEPQTPVIVLGDLNDFEDSETLRRLTAGAELVDLHAEAAGERPYTTLYRGVSQTLDYVLVEAALLPRVARFSPLHINVDFAFPGPTGTSHRASDHDPLLLVLRPTGPS
jgi:predicted extracellular nuclease